MVENKFRRMRVQISPYLHVLVSAFVSLSTYLKDENKKPYVSHMVIMIKNNHNICMIMMCISEFEYN